VPVIYYGDEQGFIGDGHDQDARENMFPSQVEVYNDNEVIGSDNNAAADNFDPNHPLYQTMKHLAAVRQTHAALRGGAQTVRFADNKAGIFAFEREDRSSGDKLLVVINSANERADALIEGVSITGSQCLRDGTPGDIEQQSAGTHYGAPALSWAVYSLGNCTK